MKLLFCETHLVYPWYQSYCTLLNSIWIFLLFHWEHLVPGTGPLFYLWLQAADQGKIPFEHRFHNSQFNVGHFKQNVSTGPSLINPEFQDGCQCSSKSSSIIHVITSVCQCLVKSSIIHTLLCNFCLWTCFHDVWIRKIFYNVFINQYNLTKLI